MGLFSFANDPEQQMVFYVRQKYAALVAQRELRGYSVGFSYNQLKTWFWEVQNNCHYCNMSLGNFLDIRDEIISYGGENKYINQFKSIFRTRQFKKINHMTIDRKDNTIGYELNNIVKACWICNSIKGQFLEEKHMLAIAPEIISKLKLNIKLEKSQNL